MLYGAIIGDIAGSIYEFNNIKHKPEEILKEECFFTDDTVMTIAVAHAINNGELKYLDEYMREWANTYPDRGYGGNFAEWIRDWSMGPYNSFGNGSAMRVSPAGWAARSFMESIKLADETAKPTHDHPEGMKGAEAVSAAIYMARTGSSKESIVRCMQDDFGYTIELCDTIRPQYKFNETCQGTVPQAISAFVESKDFEDCIKLAISLGGDSDTLAAIAGSIAEPYYGVPKDLAQKCREYLPSDMLAVIDEFKEKWGK